MAKKRRTRKVRFENPKRETQQHLPFTLEDCGGMDAVYVDQGMIRSFGFFAAKTPYGIKLLDGEYGKRIRAADGNEEERAKLKQEIIHDPHLHFVIKQNLLYNLSIR